MIHRNGDIRWEHDGVIGDFIASVEPENASKICRAFYEKVYQKVQELTRKEGRQISGGGRETCSVKSDAATDPTGAATADKDRIHFATQCKWSDCKWHGRTQPTSGKQEQEWTRQRVIALRQGSSSDKLFIDALVDAINASIKAERERGQEGRDDYIKRLREALGLKVGQPLIESAQQLREQLAATWKVLREFDHTGGNEPLSECAGVAVESHNHLKHQLAAAQAANIRVSEIVRSAPIGLETTALLMEEIESVVVGTTALDAAKRVSFQEGWEEGRRQGIELVAAAQQPLVEALTEITASYNHHGAINLAKSALAKVKEGK